MANRQAYADRLARACFGALLRQARLDAGISCLDMAARLGITTTGLYYLETSENLSEAAAKRMAAALGQRLALNIWRQPSEDAPKVAKNAPSQDAQMP